MGKMVRDMWVKGSEICGRGIGKEVYQNAGG